ncbi:MAG: PhzF family phenazine biosynthesis protein [Hyphomicrobiales bacterium]|nr:PhzF family phenazine biosynthesis protein [Hyphomicrobiales bacterium]
MRRKFYTLDVFTEEALSGNPLAVVRDAQGLDATRMQKIAREFNLSETVFLFPPRDPANTARLRIFTPTRELPFAGHPTVGAAILIAEMDAPELLAREDLQVVLEEEVGDICCTVRHVKGRAPRASFTLPRLPQKAGEASSAAKIAAALGLDVEDIGFEGHEPCLYSAGNPFAFVPLASRDAVARAWPNLSAWGEAFGQMERPAAFLYCRETVKPAHAFHARMFAPGLGVTEDPATGSAVAAFAGVIMAFEPPADGSHGFTIEQGFEMGRPSLITLGLEVEGGVLIEASIGGCAVIVQQGTIDL